EAGFDPNVALLAADEPSAPITKDLVQHPSVKIVDFTGGPAFGSWLRQSLRDKLVYTEEAGVNAIVIDSTANFRGMCDNIAFSLSLYSGQMCTARRIFSCRGPASRPTRVTRASTRSPRASPPPSIGCLPN